MAKEQEKKIISRWGNPIADDRGFVDIPGWILRNYHKCGVSPLEMMFIAHVMAFKYDHAEGQPENAAKPSLATIATYMGRDVKNVRRLKNSLKEKGLLETFEHEGDCDEYNFSGLTNRCLQYALEGTNNQAQKTSEGDSVTPPKNARPTPPKNVPTPLPKMGAEDSEEDLEQKIENSNTPKPPLGSESQISIVEIHGALEPSPLVPPPPSPFDLETQLMLFAVWRVTGMDYRLFPEVLAFIREHKSCGYVAEDISEAHRICTTTDWRWVDPKRGNQGRVMTLDDLRRYLGAVKTRNSNFKYRPEMQLDAVISRVRDAGDMAALDPGWQSALPAESSAERLEQYE